MRIQSSLTLLAIIISGLVSLSYTHYAFAECSGTSSLSAAEFLPGCASDTPGDNFIDPNLGIKEMVTNLAKTFIGMGALFAIGAIVFSGLQYTTSYGDEEKIKKAKTTIIYAVIGLLLLLTAFSLVNMVVDFIYGL